MRVISPSFAKLNKLATAPGASSSSSSGDKAKELLKVKAGVET